MHVFFTIPLYLLSYSLPCVGGFGLVSTSGGVFYEDGHPTRYAGTNALSLAQFSDPFTQQDILTRMHRANMTLLRLWAFSDGGVCSPPPSQNFFQCWDTNTSSVFQNETALSLHLDTALAAAGRAGVHVILSLVNNWPAYGGFAAYGEWREAASKAGVAPSLPGPSPRRLLRRPGHEGLVSLLGNSCCNSHQHCDRGGLQGGPHHLCLPAGQ